MSLATCPLNGTKKSCELTPFPLGVRTVKWPEAVFAGTVVARVVDVTLLTVAGLTFNRSLSFARVGSKLPVILTAAPATPLVGLKLVIVGDPLVVAVTVKFTELVAVPFGLVTEIGPAVAPVGTITVSCLFVADETVAAVPLNFTVS